MGARMKVREIASRWQMGIRKWIDPVNYAMDIRRDRDGAFFELRVPTHLLDNKLVLSNEPLRRGAGKPHLVEQLYRTGGETVHVCAKHPNGISEKEYR